ncbi:metallophosphoesterase [Paenibacillus sp. CAU 1782]
MAFWISLLIAAASAAVLLYLLLIFPTQWLKVEQVDYPLGLGKRILQISDLHVDMLRISPKALRRVIQAAAPDYIFLTGDYTYRQEYLPKLARYLEIIMSARVPVYAVLGNHDHELPRLRKLADLLESSGVVLLRNAMVDLPDFQLVGIDNYSTRHSRFTESFKRVKEGKPVLVITHDPNVVLFLRKPYDYLMAGHFHGKQFNLPFLFDIKPKGPLSAKGIYKGLHRAEDGGSYYISKGIGQAGINARFMVRSEITLHKL